MYLFVILAYSAYGRNCSVTNIVLFIYWQAINAFDQDITHSLISFIVFIITSGKMQMKLQ